MKLTGRDEMHLQQALQKPGPSQVYTEAGPEFWISRSPGGVTLVDLDQRKVLASWPLNTPTHEMLNQACNVIETGTTHPTENEQ